eukprot:CAMPEP_0119280384 /NCGR_PEP_ID=MMETSP1329-20130426/22507_1 /TAXON_ID=114041 /ORGANISM="Genus nov. species nov., Strain RCC1024" /LENGTH=452 /DNA_ID=CAMNT_0007280969 /DNA_START=188 /DNA_END=1542 /DNA_ORIENTATION=+
MPPRRKKARTNYAEDRDDDGDYEVPDAPPEEGPEDGDTAELEERHEAPAAEDDEPFPLDESEDDDEDERDAEDAERRLMRRAGRADTNDKSEAGLIHEISMSQFMCHRKLTISPCRRINFINGANGSGKSAILAALQICLGASAKSTHRGNKMGDLVREGWDGDAWVQVTLVNEGSDAARPELYGNRITIKRTFRRKGKNQLELIGQDGFTKSRDRKDLRYILDALKVSVDNPVCVLDQENSKNFIRGKAKEKYAFFLKATEIQDVLDRVQRTHAAANKCKSEAEHQRKNLSDFARMATRAQEEFEEVKRLAAYDAEIKELKTHVAWVSVRMSEKARDDAEAKRRAKQAEKDRADAAKEEAEAAMERGNAADQASLEAELTQKHEDVKACTTATKDATKLVEEQKRVHRKALQAVDREKQLLKDLADDRKKLVQELSQKRAKNQEIQRKADS